MGGKLLYSVVLVSAVPQPESALSIHKSPPSKPPCISRNRNTLSRFYEVGEPSACCTEQSESERETRVTLVTHICGILKRGTDEPAHRGGAEAQMQMTGL